MSKTTNSIMGCSQPIAHDLFCQSERKSHASPTHAGHCHYSGAEWGDGVCGCGVLDVGPVPACGNCQVRYCEEGLQIGENSASMRGLSKGSIGIAVFV